MKLMVNSLVKSTSLIISGHLRAWMKQSRCVKIANSKAGGRMKALRLALSVIRLFGIAACRVQAANSAKVSVLETKKHQLLVDAALLGQFLDV
jgi:hypothetical protein